jgi:hypothetical protein
MISPSRNYGASSLYPCSRVGERQRLAWEDHAIFDVLGRGRSSWQPRVLSKMGYEIPGGLKTLSIPAWVSVRTRSHRGSLHHCRDHHVDAGKPSERQHALQHVPETSGKGDPGQHQQGHFLIFLRTFLASRRKWTCESDTQPVFMSPEN